MIERWSFGVPGLEAELRQCTTQRRGDAHCFSVIDVGEQIHVVGRAVDETVRDHRRSAGEGEQCGLRGGSRPFAR
jgi:hypothetical protein